MQFLRLLTPKGIVMAFKDYSKAPVWYRYIKRFGLPRDPESEITAFEYGSMVYIGWDGKIFALDASDGTYRWSRTLRKVGLSTQESHEVDIIWHAGYLWATWNHRIFRLHPETGQIIDHRRANAQLIGLMD